MRNKTQNSDFILIWKYHKFPTMKKKFKITSINFEAARQHVKTSRKEKEKLESLLVIYMRSPFNIPHTTEG